MLTRELLEQTLVAAGYEGEPTEANVREMFGDYVDAGYFSNIDPEEIETIETIEICSWFVGRKSIPTPGTRN